MKLIHLFLFVITIYGFSQNNNNKATRCMLVDNLSGYRASTDNNLIDVMLNVDTLTHYLDPRNGIYINMIGIVSIDSSKMEQRFYAKEVFIFGDTLADREFEAYFKNQYKLYIDSLISRFPVMLNSTPEDCPRGLIHQRKIRFCG